MTTIDDISTRAYKLIEFSIQCATTQRMHLELFALAFLQETGANPSECELCEVSEGLTIRWYFRKQEQAVAGDYLLFFGDVYYPSGGAKDFVFRGTLRECQDKLRIELCGCDTAHQWANVFDLSTNTTIPLYNHEGEWLTTPPPDPV